MRFRYYGLAAALALTLGAGVLNAAENDSEVLAVWRNAMRVTEPAAEAAYRRGDLPEAIRLYEQALDSYLLIKQTRPGWNQELLDSKIAAGNKNLTELRSALARTTASKSPAPASAVAAVVTPAAEAELAATKEKLFKALIEMDDLRRELQGVKASTQEIEGLLREKRLLQEKYSMLELQYQTLLNKATSPDSEKEALQKQLLEAQVSYDLLHQKGLLIEKKFNETSEELAKAYQERNQMRLDAKSATDRLALLERDVTRLTTLRQAGEDSEAQLRSRIETLTAERDEARTQFAAKQKEYEVLLTRLAERLGDDQTATQLLAGNQELQLRYDELQRDYNTLNSDFRAAREQQRELQLKLTRQGDTLQRVDDVRKQLEQANKDLGTRLDQQNIALDLGRSTEKQATERARVLEGSLKELQIKAAALDDRLKARESVELQNTESRNTELQKLRDQLAGAEGRGAELAAIGEETKKKLTAAENRIAELRQEYIAEKAANASLEVDLRQLTDLRARHAELERTIADLEQTIAELEARPAGTDTIAGLERQLAEARQEIEELRQAAPAAAQTVPAAPVAVVPVPASGTVRGTVRILSDAEIAAGLESAQEALANGTSELAIWEYKRILRARPDQFEANRELGRICLAEQRFFDAVQHLTVAAEQAPEDSALMVDRALALTGAGDAQKGLELLQQALAAQPDSVRVLQGCGRAYLQLNRLADAETALRRALELNRADAEVLLDLARLLIVLDRKEEAVGYYEQARKAGAYPDSSIESSLGMKLAVNRELGEFLTKAAQEAIGARDWDSAAWYYSQLTGMEPRNDEWQNRLALIQLQRGDATAALAAVAAGRSAHPQTEPGNEALRLALAGAAYASARQPGEAAKCFDELAALSTPAPWSTQNFFAPLPAMIEEALKRLGQSPDLAQAEIKQAMDAWAKAGGAAANK